MSDQLVKQVQSSGTKISKEKLLEMIRKNTAKDYPYAQASGSKAIVVAFPL